ncbi:hypothetical protein FRC16_003147 [Serendipita sp. 398]|nr:hypothetical protein FRC16_003147 [Serendipita sp. 398]
MGPPSGHGTHRDSGWPQESTSRAKSTSQSDSWSTQATRGIPASSRNNEGATSSRPTATLQTQLTWSKETPQQSTWSKEPWGQSTSSKSNEQQLKPKTRTFEDDWGDIGPPQSKANVDDNWGKGIPPPPKPKAHSIEDIWGDVNPPPTNKKSEDLGFTASSITSNPPTTNTWITNDNPWSSPTTATPESVLSKKAGQWPNTDMLSSAQSGGSERLTTQSLPTTTKVSTAKQPISTPAKETSSSTAFVSSPTSLNPVGVGTLVPDKSNLWTIQNSSVDTPMTDAQSDAGKPSLTLTMGNPLSESGDIGQAPASADYQAFRYKLPQTPADSRRKDSISSQIQPLSSSASIAMATPLNSAGPGLPLTAESRFDNDMQALWSSRIQLIRTAVDYLEERSKTQDAIACRQSLVKRIRSKAKLPPLDTIPMSNEKEFELKKMDEKYQTVLKGLVQETEADYLSDSSNSKNWWPIPRLGISYENALDSLEEDLFGLEGIGKQESVVTMEEAPPEAEAAKEPVALPGYSELHETLDDFRDRVRATSQLVHNQNERLPVLLRQVVRERYRHTPAEDTRISLEERLMTLKDQYQGLATAAMDLNSELKELKAQRKKQEATFRQLQIEVEDTRLEQEALAARYQQLLQRAKGLQNIQKSQPTLAETVKPLVTSDSSTSQLGDYLVSKLRPATENYHAEDRAYIETIHAKISKEFESELEARQRDRAQRYEGFLNHLQADPAILEMDKIGATIDERWNDVISRSVTIRRPTAIIRIPETA